MIYHIATAKDLPQLAELRWEFRMEDGTEQPLVSREQFIQICTHFLQESLATGYHTYWVAEQDGQIISHIFVHRIDLVPRPCKLRDQFGYITNTYTRPAYRNQGIGSLLLHHVKQWATEQDFELLIVYPSEQAIPYYERAGFCTENEVMELKLREY